MATSLAFGTTVSRNDFTGDMGRAISSADRSSKNKGPSKSVFVYSSPKLLSVMKNFLYLTKDKSLKAE